MFLFQNCFAVPISNYHPPFLVVKYMYTLSNLLILIGFIAIVIETGSVTLLNQQDESEMWQRLESSDALHDNLQDGSVRSLLGCVGSKCTNEFDEHTTETLPIKEKVRTRAQIIKFMNMIEIDSELKAKIIETFDNNNIAHGARDSIKPNITPKQFVMDTAIKICRSAIFDLNKLNSQKEDALSREQQMELIELKRYPLGMVESVSMFAC